MCVSHATLNQALHLILISHMYVKKGKAQNMHIKHTKIEEKIHPPGLITLTKRGTNVCVSHKMFALIQLKNKQNPPIKQYRHNF